MESIRRIIGCCNNLNDTCLTPHDIGGYMVSLLSRHPRFRNCHFFYPREGINNALIDARPTLHDLVILDDVNLRIGNVKIIRLSRYGKRGHNAVRWYMDRSGYGTHHDPLMMLVGVGPISLSRINDYMNPRDQIRIKVFCLGLYRGMYRWPNESHVIQIAKYFLRIYLDSNGREGYGREDINDGDR